MSPNMVPFDMLGLVSYYCPTATLSLDPLFFRYSTSKNVVTLKSGSEVTEGYRNRHGLIRHL